MNSNLTDQEKQLQLMEMVGNQMARHVEDHSPVTLDFQPSSRRSILKTLLWFTATLFLTLMILFSLGGVKLWYGYPC